MRYNSVFKQLSQKEREEWKETYNSTNKYTKETKENQIKMSRAARGYAEGSPEWKCVCGERYGAGEKIDASQAT